MFAGAAHTTRTATPVSAQPEPVSAGSSYSDPNYPWADYGACGTDMFVELASDDFSGASARSFSMASTPRNSVPPSILGASVSPNGTSGLRITSLLAGSAAEAAGLKVNDIIVSINGKPLSMGDMAAHRAFYLEIDASGRGGLVEFDTLRWTGAGWRAQTVALQLGGIEP